MISKAPENGTWAQALRWFFGIKDHRPLSTPPTSNSSPLKFTSPVLPNPVNSKIADDDLSPHNEASCKISTTESPAGHHRPKRSRTEYTLSQVGDRDEDLDLPSKRLKTLQTTWNCTGLPSETSAYFNGRMLELSRVTRQAITARMQYQRIRYHELDLIKSILHDENELAQTQLIAVDTQISSLQNALKDGEVPIEKTGSKGPGIPLGVSSIPSFTLELMKVILHGKKSVESVVKVVVFALDICALFGLYCFE
ncbi:hypothetical protein BDR04DRAFT_1123586 [Suillus decipiens]|nr:hypothetical protein BDR04DRAFT_1123586 [Suillus decipiens]